MALDPELRKRLQAQQDEIMKSTIGDERFAAMKKRQHLDSVCYKCPHRDMDEEGKLGPCDPLNDFHCMRAREKELME